MGLPSLWRKATSAQWQALVTPLPLPLSLMLPHWGLQPGSWDLGSQKSGLRIEVGVQEHLSYPQFLAGVRSGSLDGAGCGRRARAEETQTTDQAVAGDSCYKSLTLGPSDLSP